MSTALIEATRRSFGDMAEVLISKGAVMPVNENKVPMVKWGGYKPRYIDPYRHYDAWGYGIMTGTHTGIAVIDYDNDAPAGGNVLTLRGSHIWTTPLDTDKSKNGILPKIDFKSNGGYAVFASPNHKVVHTDLSSRDNYEHILKNLSSSTKKKEKEEGYENGGHFEVIDGNSYLDEVRAHGYNVDLVWVTKLLASQMRSNTDEGNRNQMLFKHLCNIIHLGGSEQQVRQIMSAANDSGLAWDEIYKVYGSAKKYGVIPVMDIANEWAVSARAVLPKSPVIEELVRLSTEQHNTMPLVSKKGMSAEAEIPLSTVKRHLDKLEEAGVVKEHVNEGFRVVNGRKLNHANNYKLVLPGTGVDN